MLGNSQPPMGATRSLTIYLLRQEVTDIYAAVEVEPADGIEPVPAVPDQEWLLCIRNTPEKRPKWTEFFRDFVDLEKFGRNRSVSAALVLPAAGRVWAVTFGQGRRFLRDGTIEERFGLKAALNTVGSARIRAIDKQTFDSIASQARQQAITDTDFNNFGVDVDRDLLNAVTGVPRNPFMGRRVTGRDALCLSAPVSLVDLPAFLDQLLQVGSSKSYSTEFPWVDNVNEIRDKGLRRELDGRLVLKLRSRDRTNAWLALPEIVDWARTDGFTYTNPKPQFKVDDLHLDSFLDSMGSALGSLDLLALKKRRVLALDKDGVEFDHWNAYHCLYAEIESEKDVFLLTNGHWYRINREIVAEIRAWYDHLPIDNGLLPEMRIKESEPEYNQRIGSQAGYTLFHNTIVHLPLNRGGIEFCDLLALSASSVDLIHVKRFRKSDQLSHLFSQGTTAGMLFKTSPEFRKALCEKDQSQPIGGLLAEEPVRGKFRIVFAIASSSEGRLNLPLFSKISLKQAIRWLEGLGYSTLLCKIQIPPEERKNFKPRGNRTRKVF